MTKQQPLAVLADIHGNSMALEAVLADAKKRGLTKFANLGDTFYGPLDPAGTWSILKDMDIPTILGNQDRILIEDNPENTPALQAARTALGNMGLAWLETLPPTLILNETILLCHGTPESDTTYLLEDVATGLPLPRSCIDILDDLMPTARNCTLVLTGHSHHAGRISCQGVTIVNPGSVGLPAYDDDTPPHKMTSGSPHARYAILSPNSAGWKTEFIEVEYDWEAVSRLAQANKREDWARWLLTGQA
jgi:predicted phosphodiesterase